MINEIKRILKKNYNLKILDFKNSNFTGFSSKHYEFLDEHKNKFIVKVNRRLDVLIGKEYIKLISQKMEIVNELRNNNILVEKCVRNKKNNFVTKFNKNSILRVYNFQIGNKINYSNTKIKKISIFLNTIHKFNIKKFKKKYNLFFLKKLPYNLNYTIKYYDKFKNKILKLNYKNKDIKFLINNFDFIENIINFVKLYKKNIICNEYGLIHQDFHSGNIIFNKNKIYLLDFDYLEYGNIEKCRALAILRYSFSKNRNLKKLKSNIRDWLSEIQLKSSEKIIKKYLILMIFIEIEKLLRIYMRYIDTKQHKRYLIQAQKVHIPNLKKIIQNFNI